MSSGPASRSGSRFLYEPFACAKPDCAPALKLEAYERIMDERWKALDYRLDTIEAVIGRVEKRLWATIIGVAGVVLTEAATSILIP